MELFLEARQLIVSTAQELVRSGFLIATGGNLSYRVPGENVFAITPSNMDYMQMTAADVCLLDSDLKQVAGERKPSVESSMHAAIYSARADAHAIIHTHQVYSSTLALVNVPIPSLFDEQVRFLGREVKVIPYAPSGTSMLRNKIRRHVKDHNNAYLMQNHGALVLGTDMERAVLNVALLEKCALTYLLALASGAKTTTIPPLVREVAFNKLRHDQKELTD